jgi:hypothetical protein
LTAIGDEELCFPLTDLNAGQLTDLPPDADELKHLSMYALVSLFIFAEQVGWKQRGQ